MSFTSRSDIARYLAHVLTSTCLPTDLSLFVSFDLTLFDLLALALPPSKLDYRTFLVEGSRASLLELIALIENKTGQFNVVHTSIDDALERAKIPDHFSDFVKAQWALGNGCPKTESVVEETNALFPAWNPTPVQSFI